jgi:tripartite-type tricarboxylate transporter receptor subunit TctC
MDGRFKKVALAASAAFLTGALHGVAIAQSYPAKPVRIVVGLAPGGGTDIVARMVGQRLGAAINQQVVIDNRPGASGNIAAEIVAKAPADGYTLIMTNDQLVVQASFASKLPFDPIRDFAPIGIMARGPVVLGVHPSVKANSVSELVALARSQRGKLAFSSCGNGTVLHLAGELLNLAAGIDLTHIPYRGCAPAIADVVAGQVPVFFTVLGNAVGFEKSGKVRLLGVASLQRLKSFPDLPTIAEAGFQGYDAYPWFGLLAPAQTPREIVLRLAGEVAAAVDAPDVNEKIRGYFLEPTTASPEAFAEIMKDDLARWSRVVREAKLKIE